MHDVESALQELSDRDELTGRHVHVAWQTLSAGRDDYRPCQQDVQLYLWVVLPRQVWESTGMPPLPNWRPVADALADFFDLIGHPRYAAICRSDETELVLSAVDDPQRCAEFAELAMVESGIVPPQDLELRWLAEPGPVENQVKDTISRVLELAITDGLLARDADDFDTQQLGIASQVLNSTAPEESATMLQQLLAERLQRRSKRVRSQTLRELIVRTAVDVAKAPEEHRIVGQKGLRPLETLLKACAEDGAKLTGSGYLPTDLVGRLAALLPTAEGGGSRKSESTCPPVQTLRELAKTCGYLRKYKGRLRLTAAGGAVHDEDGTLFASVSTALLTAVEPLVAQVSEVVFTTFLLQDDIQFDALDNRIAQVLHETGWRMADHMLDTDVVMEDIVGLRLAILGDLEVLGGIEDSRRVTEFGRTIMRAALRAQSMNAQEAW